MSWLRPVSSGKIRDRLKIVGDQLVFNFFLLQPRCFLAEARTKRSCGPDRIQLRSRLANIPGTDQPLTLTPPDSESPLAAESVPIDASGLYKIAHSVDGNGSEKGNPATAKFTATTASEATDTA